MINFTIDTSIITPPEYIDDDFNNKIITYYDNLIRINNLVNIEEISLYLFWASENKLNNDYIKKNVKNSMLPIDKLKSLTSQLYSMFFPDLDYKRNTCKNRKYYLFEDKFKIYDINYSNIESKYEICNKENNYISIGFLNKHIYRSNVLHYLLGNENKEISINCKELTLIIDKKINKEENIEFNIIVKNINDINYENNIKFNTVSEAYNNVKKIFSDYIIFGNDVEKGIKTIRDTAGPPDRIFEYLKILRDYCQIKRSFNYNFPDDYLLEALGCDCSYENSKHMDIEEIREARIFDNGNNEKELFNLHLKPCTFNQNRNDCGNKKRTVRIYISWNEKMKKVVVGWIGEHLILP